ncbi:lymphocyte-specific helicase-like isoform X2 [Ostrea edulis]|uniref:lymphocyte-specific helicase-like isoform X2 n=1 Tax=Ostrea edulis TaxID=37623 RepID=UPI0024AEF6CB|nr:lymphocyte-specific helicase-like isoform X2 [Ostrea edulis]
MTEVLRTLSPQIPNVEAAVPKEAAKSRNVEHSAETAAKNSAKGQIDVTQHLGENGDQDAQIVEETSATMENNNKESKDREEQSKEVVVTNEMEKEEVNLENEAKKEEQKVKQEQQKIWDQLDSEDRELRYSKLQFLLNKSTMYTKYLIQRIERQKQEEKRKTERLAKKLAKKTQLESSLTKKSLVEERRSSRNRQSTNSLLPLPPATAQEEKQGRCKKRKTAMDSSEAMLSAKRRKENEADSQNSFENVNSNEADLSQTMNKDSDIGTDSTSPSDDEEEKARKKAEEKALLEKNEDCPVLFTGGSLRQYQKDGYKWLKTLYENGVNGILADEMGLGKTVQCIAVISHLMYLGVTGPFLVVAPLSTIPNWHSEFKRFAPKVPVVLYHGTPEERNRLRAQIRKTTAIREGVGVQPVVITSYEITMRDRSQLQHHEWKILIVDEGHRIKNTHCRLIRELRMYRNTHRLLLTGTPLQNNLAELWSLLNFLLPEIFDDLGSFEMWFDVERLSVDDADEKIVKEEQQKNILSMLHQILTPFMLRRLKQDVELKLPPKKEVLVYAPLSSIQQEFYTSTVDRTIIKKIHEKNEGPEVVEMDRNDRPVRKSRNKSIDYSVMCLEDNDKEKQDDENESDVEEQMEKWFSGVQKMTSSLREKLPAQSVVTIRMQNIMMQLRKCCNHPYLLEYPLTADGQYRVDEELIQVCGKMKLLDTMLKELKSRGHKVLIFSQMTKMLDILQDFCYLREYSFCRLDGSTHIQERQEQMADFNENPNTFIFLLSTRAGGLGINLTGADTVIIYDSDWNPQCDIQAQDRCHRIGQTKPVIIYRIVTANTIDQRIVERAAAKRKLEKMVIHKGRFKSGIESFTETMKPLTPQELMDLLKAKDHEKEVEDVENLSKEALNSLLDRSDLYAKWKGDINKATKAKAQRSKAKNSRTPQTTEDLASVFSIIDEDVE